MRKIGLFAGAAFMLVSGAALASVPDFNTWLAGMRSEALREGISPRIVSIALSDNLTPIERVIELDRKQPEKTITFEEYVERIVNHRRIERGREMYQRHRALLEEVGQKYGVPPQYIVALWGIETNYGSNTGGFEVVQSLATLAWEGRRADFFRKELMNALKILDEGHISPDQMKGSWAGAMGQSQFMPSSFNNFAVDYDGDGRRDIWNTHADVFASAANYLARNGWNGDIRWGRKVSLPAGISRDLMGLDRKYGLDFWQKAGVRRLDGSALPFEESVKASLIQPGGEGTQAFLVYGNYEVIMSWNRSLYFATSVGLLADQIAYN